MSLKDKFSEADAPHLRIKFVNDMIFNGFNSSDVGRSLVMEYDDEVRLVVLSLCLLFGLVLNWHLFPFSFQVYEKHFKQP